MKIKFSLIAGILVLIVATLFVGAATFDSSNPQITYPGGASSAYLSRQGVDLFPGFTAAKNCGAGQDFALQIAPTGCEPKVIRSDLLEEQNVPVFCPIVATQINPAIDVNAIDYMSFGGTYPKEVSGVAFHPVQAAVQSGSNGADLINYPLLDTVGYAVIVLKQQPNESSMSDSVEGNLTAHIRYDIENAFGVGQATYYLQLMSDEEWDNHFKEYSFWQGNGFLRLDYADSESVNIGIYRDKDYEVTSVPLKIGETSSDIYLPGLFCQAGLQVRLDSFVNPDTYVRLNVGDDVVDVFPNGKFLNNLCYINNVYGSGLVKSVHVTCRTSDARSGSFDLFLSPQINFDVGGTTAFYTVGKKINTNYALVYAEAIGNSYDSSHLVVWLEKRTTPRDVGSAELKNIEQQIKNLKDRDAIYASKKSQAIAGTNLVVLFFNNVYDDKTNQITLKGYATKTVSTEEMTTPPWENTFNSAINAYKDLEQKYPYITQKNKYGQELEGATTYSEQGLREAIELASKTGKETDKEVLIALLNKDYPTEATKAFLNTVNNDYLLSNSQQASQTVYVNGKYYPISLIDVYEPQLKDYGVQVIIGGKTTQMMKGVPVTFNVPLTSTTTATPTTTPSTTKTTTTTGVETISLNILDESSATFTVNGADGRTRTYTLKLKETKAIDGVPVILDAIYLTKMAQVEVIPNIENAGTDANITFKIGIEKRAIDLSTDEIKKKIDELNTTISDWQSKSDNLGNVVEGLKGACLATGLYLSAKDIIFSSGDEVQARSYTMRGIDGNGGIMKYCADNIKLYGSTQKCLENSTVIKMINDGVSASKQVIDEQNKKLEEIRNSKGTLLTETWYGEQFVNDTEFLRKYADYVGTKLGNKNINAQTSAYGGYAIDDLRELEYCNLLKQQTGVSDAILKDCQNKEKTILQNIQDAQTAYDANAKTQDALKGFTVPNNVALALTSDSYGNDKALVGKYHGGAILADNIIGEGVGKPGEQVKVQVITYMNDPYLVVLNPTNSQELSVVSAYKISNIDSATQKITVSGDATAFIKSKFSKFVPLSSGTYNVPITHPQIRYFSTAPNKDKPALVPFSFLTYQGFYVAVRQKISIGATESYDASGVPNSYYVCNAGNDGSMDFNPEVGTTSGDECYGFDPAGGVIPATNAFGFSVDQVRQLATRAANALLEAERNTRRSPGDTVIIAGITSTIGEAAANIPNTQCQDLHSPEDCALLFNVCDPVVCPPSRCNLGGTFQVSDVIQSGIVGSVFLCLPNFGSPSAGKVLIPICLTGIKAGIDGLLSVFKSYRDCLQEKLDTGKTIGICDEVYSLYLCDFLWRQIAPLTDIIIPKLLQYFSGQFVRGGGEYMNVATAWTNAEKSMDYFTQQYAVNSFKAFQTSSLGDVIGSQVCKNFVSAGVNADLGDILTPESPPQYYGNFQEIPFTTATIPPTSQYSVYYHIYAGENEGAAYRVYLKTPQGLSIYYDNPTLMVDSGYINAGESVDQKKDSTAPSGYQQMCIMVNGQEECGFKQVTSSFAVDYATSAYMKEQASNVNVTTESECLSGSSSLYSLLNPNFQAGVENTINPDLAANGIVRVCSTANPGKNVNPDKWLLSGYCGDPQLKCWTDKDSVKKAIQSSSMENDTLNVLTQNTLNALAQEGNYMSFADFDNFVKGAKTLTDKTEFSDDDKNSLGLLVTQIDAVLATSSSETTATNVKVAVFDWQRAELMLLKARAYNRLTTIQKSQADAGRTVVSATAIPSGAVDISDGSEKSFSLSQGQSVTLSLGDGSTKTLTVTEISAGIKISVDSSSYSFSVGGSFDFELGDSGILEVTLSGMSDSGTKADIKVKLLTIPSIQNVASTPEASSSTSAETKSPSVSSLDSVPTSGSLEIQIDVSDVAIDYKVWDDSMKDYYVSGWEKYLSPGKSYIWKEGDNKWYKLKSDNTLIVVPELGNTFDGGAHKLSYGIDGTGDNDGKLRWRYKYGTSDWSTYSTWTLELHSSSNKARAYSDLNSFYGTEKRTIEYKATAGTSDNTKKYTTFNGLVSDCGSTPKSSSCPFTSFSIRGQTSFTNENTLLLYNSITSSLSSGALNMQTSSTIDASRCFGFKIDVENSGYFAEIKNSGSSVGYFKYSDESIQVLLGSGGVLNVDVDKKFSSSSFYYKKRVTSPITDIKNGGFDLDDEVTITYLGENDCSSFF